MPHDTATAYPGIMIRMKTANESVMFPSLVNEALGRIAALPTGQKLLTGVTARVAKAKFGYTVCIMRADMTGDPGCVTKWKGTNVATRGNELDAVTPGQSSITAIKYNANMITSPDGNRPSWVGLAHELIHAYYNLKGKGKPAGLRMNVSGMVEQEELATVGLGPGPHRSITENKIRHEAHLPLRTTYGGK